MDALITFTISQPAAQGPVYITYACKSTDSTTFYASVTNWRCYVYGTSGNTVAMTPDVGDGQHQESFNIVFSPTGTTKKWVWNTSEDISETLYSSLAKINVTASLCSDPSDTESFTSSTFELDMRAAETSEDDTHIVSYLGDIVRLLYKRLEGGSGFTPPATPQVTHVYDADGNEQLSGSPADPITMTEDSAGAYYIDHSASSSATGGDWSYVVLDGSTSHTFYFTVREQEVALNYRSDECVMSGYMVDASGEPLGERSVFITLDTPYYNANSTTVPDYAAVTTAVDSDVYLELHVPQGLHIIVAIDGFKTSKITVPSQAIYPLLSLI